jgi:hypothetical protein
MSQMPAAIDRQRFAVRTLPGILARFSEVESEQRPAPERWTKKEVIGHLIDSASNNHQRFVRGQLASGQDFPGYEQEQWVRIQGYQSARWPDLIDLWRAYNAHLLHVAECMTEQGRCATCRVRGGAEVTLAELFVGYVDHLEHQALYSTVLHGKGVTDDSRFLEVVLSSIRQFMQDHGQESVYRRFIAPACASVRFAKALGQGGSRYGFPREALRALVDSIGS